MQKLKSWETIFEAQRRVRVIPPAKCSHKYRGREKYIGAFLLQELDSRLVTNNILLFAG